MTYLRGGLLLTVITAGTLLAQAPDAVAAQRAPATRGSANVAQLLLANSAQLQLNDQQVTRLAAIARRAESRDQARRAAFDSLRSRSMALAGDSASRAARRTEMANTMRAAMQRARDERHADLRDALAVLNADQQARAWDLRGAGDRGPRARSAVRRMQRGGMRPGAGRAMRDGMRPRMRRPL